MAANTNPIFVLSPGIDMAQVSTANTNRDGTGTIVDITTGSVEGTRINRIDVVAVGTVTAGMVRLYISDGSNTRLWKEVPITATTPSGSDETFKSSVVPTFPLILPLNYKLRASTHIAETFNVIVHKGNY